MFNSDRNYEDMKMKDCKDCKKGMCKKHAMKSKKNKGNLCRI